MVNNNLGRRGGCTFWFLPPLAVLIVWAAWHYDARGAELALPRHGKFMDRVLDGPIDKFGTYGDEYYRRRWERMCKTGARYEAMREANDLGKGFPC